MPVFTVVKDPQAKLDYGIDWGGGWLIDGDTIMTSSWSCDDLDITILSESHTDTTTTVWIIGGIADQDYLLVNHIVTVQSREDDRTIRIKCRQK